MRGRRDTARAMSQENVELVRSIYGAWECGDFSSAEWADPEIEYAVPDGPLIGTWRGLEGMAEAMREFLRAWEDWRVTAEDYRELDAEHVLVPFRFGGRGKTSGLELGQVRTKGASLFPGPRRQGDKARPTLRPRARARRPRPGSRVGGVGDVAGER